MQTLKTSEHQYHLLGNIGEHNEKIEKCPNQLSTPIKICIGIGILSTTLNCMLLTSTAFLLLISLNDSEPNYLLIKNNLGVAATLLTVSVVCTFTALVMKKAQNKKTEQHTNTLATATIDRNTAALGVSILPLTLASIYLLSSPSTNHSEIYFLTLMGVLGMTALFIGCNSARYVLNRCI